MYVTDFKKLAEFYNFVEMVELMVSDHIICGIANECW